MIGRNVMQTMCWMTPNEYEQIQVMNAWAGRSDLIGLRHIDEFNQSAGRNIGFRRRGDVQHVLLVNRRLFEVLLDHPKGVLGHARYDIRLCLDTDDRYEAQHREKLRAA